jgi:RNA-directed DNA polymerase
LFGEDGLVIFGKFEKSFEGATHLVICCRGKAEEALATMRDMMVRLKLTVNEKKTQVCKLPEEKFEFLGYTFGRCYSSKTGKPI